MLSDGRLERAGRAKKISSKTETNSVASNGINNSNEGEQIISRSASVIVVGDEILCVISHTYIYIYRCSLLDLRSCSLVKLTPFVFVLIIEIYVKSL
jgi:DeoR/GlpR family transcriptional regulator of sugar metabolism